MKYPEDWELPQILDTGSPEQRLIRDQTSSPVNLSGEQLVLACERRRIKTRRSSPTEQHLCTTIYDIVGTVVS